MLINGIHYHLESSGVGEPLVLLHGFSGSGASWADHAAIFARHFRVVIIDLLGHGKTDSPSDPARCRIEPSAADLITILDALELSSANLLGYSMGGRLALYAALTYPTRFRRLILESASPGLKTAVERETRVAQDEALAARIERDGIASFAEYWSNLPLFATQTLEIRQRLHARRLHNRPTGLANSLRGMGTGVQPPLWGRLGELALPTLLIAGALDTKFSALSRAMHEQIHASVMTIIPDAGHTVHAEQPEQYRRAILSFLSL